MARATIHASVESLPLYFITGWLLPPIDIKNCFFSERVPPALSTIGITGALPPGNVTARERQLRVSRLRGGDNIATTSQRRNRLWRHVRPSTSGNDVSLTLTECKLLSGCQTSGISPHLIFSGPGEAAGGGCPESGGGGPAAFCCPRFLLPLWKR